MRLEGFLLVVFFVVVVLFVFSGKIPLRQLVYRVLDLPPSMRPLVYDFGQLNQDTEKDYITQIVKDHVSVNKSLSNAYFLYMYVQMKAHSILQKHKGYSKAISETLKTAQTYMRARNVRDIVNFIVLFLLAFFGIL